MKNILSARFANPQGSAVVVQTDDDPAILIDLSGASDNSGGLRPVYLAWVGAGNQPEPYVNAD